MSAHVRIGLEMHEEVKGHKRRKILQEKDFYFEFSFDRYRMVGGFTPVTHN